MSIHDIKIDFKLENIIKYSNRTHYLKWVLNSDSKNLSIRYHEVFQDKPELVGKYILKDHLNKEWVLLSKKMAENIINSKDVLSVEEVYGYLVKGEYHKLIKPSGEVQWYHRNEKALDEADVDKVWEVEEQSGHKTLVRTFHLRKFNIRLKNSELFDVFYNHQNSKKFDDKLMCSYDELLKFIQQNTNVLNSKVVLPSEEKLVELLSNDEATEAVKDVYRIPTREEIDIYIKRKGGLYNRTFLIYDDKLSLYRSRSKKITKLPGDGLNNMSYKFHIVLVKNGKKSFLFKRVGFEDIRLIEKIVEEYNTKPKTRIKKTKAVSEGTKKNQRRSKHIPMNTKHKTGILYVSAHVPFGRTMAYKEAPLRSNVFSMRAYIKPTFENEGILYKDFEFNDVGLINGRFYIDSEIKRLKYTNDLYFKKTDYDFIEQYGPTNWIKLSGFKSDFNYDDYMYQQTNRYFDLDPSYEIPESFPSRIIQDYHEEVQMCDIPSNMLHNITKF